MSAVETATPDRIFQVGECIRRGMDLDVVHTATGIDVWFLDQMKAIYEERDVLTTATPQSLDRQSWRRAKRLGFSDAQLAWLWSTD